MSEIEKIKQLRERTGAGFKDCNLAIKESNGEIDKAIEILRIKLEKEFCLDSYYWKNIYDKISSSKPVISIIERLKEEQKNENGNVLKA